MINSGSTFLSKLFLLSVAGGITFWVTTFVTSLLPLAARYRASFSNWGIQTVWIASLIIGLVIGCSVGYFLLRGVESGSTIDPVLKSIYLSLIALFIAIMLIDVPMLLQTGMDTLGYFFVGVLFNAARFILLGLAVGTLYMKFLRSN